MIRAEEQYMFRRGIGPAFDSLLQRDFGHDNAQEIAAVPAFVHHSFAISALLQTRPREKAAVVPRLQRPALVGCEGKITESGPSKFTALDSTLYTAKFPADSSM